MLSQCLAIARREFSFMWRDKDLRYILLLGPLLGLLLFYATFSYQAIKDIPTAIVDLDHSVTSQELVENIHGAENLKITAYPASYDELADLIKKGEVVAGVVIPENYGKDVSLARQTQVAMIVDGSNMIYATNATSAMLSVTRTLSAQTGVKALAARGIQSAQAAAAYQPVEFREEAWFNPTLNFISKSAAQIMTFIAIALPVFFLAFAVFKIPLRCSFLLFFLFSLAFAIALHSVGALTSSIAGNAVNAARFGMIIALPSFLVSGYTWPLDAMPGYLQIIAKILPQTWYFQGINLLSFKDPGWAYMSQYFLAFFIIAALCYTTSAVIVARKT
ncbi:MAG: ABC transporter permease [Desulfotomaculaceae bacterium]|nr:ABC transporter permease [Desulfotomaculaceae bacterium]MDD4767095.1 ABC transporter permease [Desulfotomaculaceae bacterium]